MDIKAGLLYTCNETCEMNVGAVFTASQNSQTVSMRPSEAKGSHAMFATEQRWCRVVTTNKKRGEAAFFGKVKWLVTS